MRSLLRTATLTFVVLAMLGCATTPKPIRDAFDKTVQTSGPVNYDDFRLAASGNMFFGMTFVQGSDPDRHNYVEIASITKASAETKRRYDAGMTKTLVMGALGMAGGALVGYPIGTATSKPWGTTQTYTLAAGLGLVLVSGVVSMFATDDFQMAVSSYNEALKNQP